MARPILLRLGTRGSPLALWQAQWVADRLRERGVTVELLTLRTEGDRRRAGPIAGMSLRGVFTRAIQQALLDGRIDLAVHSLKDLPTESAEGLCLAAVPQRGAVFDVLISRDGCLLDRLPAGARVGTGSARRKAMLLGVRSDLAVVDLRGNVETRVGRVDRGELEAVVLAAAGIERLGLAERIAETLNPPRFLPAVGQGALGLETRLDDMLAREAVAALNDEASWQAAAAERALLSALHGGCLAPVGAWARMEQDQFKLSAAVFSDTGSERIEFHAVGVREKAEELGRHVAGVLLEQGAGRLITAARGDSSRR